MNTAKKLMMFFLGAAAALIIISCEKFDNDFPGVDAPSLNEEATKAVINSPLAAPVLMDIPDQIIFQGQSFCCIPLDQYVCDPDNQDCDMCWSFQGNQELILTIDQCRKVSIEVPSVGWIGSETIRFTVMDPDRHFASEQVTFTVEKKEHINPVPVPAEEGKYTLDDVLKEKVTF